VGIANSVSIVCDPLAGVCAFTLNVKIRSGHPSLEIAKQLDSSNLNIAMADLRLDISVEDEIRQAVSQGRIAIAHTNNISVPGWSGAGYLILDPEIMDGSYKISGGFNGGLILMGFSILLLTFAIGIATGGLGLLAAAGAAYQFFFGFNNFLEQLSESGLSEEEQLNALSNRVFLFFISSVAAILGAIIGAVGLTAELTGNLRALGLLLSFLGLAIPPTIL